MKKVRKGKEPDELRAYRKAAPQGTWENLRNDTLWGGPKAYATCRQRTIQDQGGLCAYCEIDIRNIDPLMCRVEHFHPKSDLTGPANWALDWQNMLGVCNGGSHPHVTAPGFLLEPLAKNLSCDAYKDQRIQSGALPAACEGWILDPMQILAFPSLFKVRMFDGFLEPDDAACSAYGNWASNKHATVAQLAQHTIDMLNLNCDRLALSRRTLIRNIEKNKKLQRDKGYSATQGLTNLADLYFRRNWPGFFTVIRFCLGPTAEAYLQGANFQG